MHEIGFDSSALDDALVGWMAAAQERYLRELRSAEVGRALRALSSAYVERRHKVTSGQTLDSAGKRAAFALYYAPLHFVATAHVVAHIGAHMPAPASVLDLGCGTGSAGAAWAMLSGGCPVSGIDRHPWAAAEATWTYRQLGLQGQGRTGDAASVLRVRPGTAIVAAYLLNELPPDVRVRLEDQLLDAAAHGARVLVLEPIAKAITPWWPSTADRFVAAGGRADEWRVAPTLPPAVALLGKGAGLNYRELKVRSLYLDKALSPKP